MGLTKCQVKSQHWVQCRHTSVVQFSQDSAEQWDIRTSMFYFSVLAYKLSAEITQMPWLKKSSSVCILILNGNSCTSLVFQIWRYRFLLSLWQVFCIPLFLEYLMILFFHLLSFVLIRPSLGLQMALSLDFLSLALFLEFISAPILFPPTPHSILLWSFFSLKIFA